MRRSRASRREATVELTPLIDVVFLLLIFFMVSTSFVQNQALNVDLPQANGDAQPNEDLFINVVVQQNGRYEIEGSIVVDTSLQGLAKTLQAVVEKNAARRTSLPVVISADATATHQSVVRVMDACAQVGLTQISLATQPILEPPKE
ncbi:MAG: biopolymer transporter ExbD [Gammaproteobacteria bacterium]|nr:biopolymer transporter ExbD [Gammaproteobacteria bacterium]MBT3695479.1 biopolymer transporter ExbD [Gammaproteobacteria bacterium]MBT5332595.1 biopolymer transporter ExbD [Gammaproteobacteria bacterium]MBT5680852.1 biopolymer transporter ExbD [Gammaproteobacteria bacterium]MBT6025912.1 biopolymer transporter ExbD [Gammaproteobacteria bacterium]